MKGYKLFLTAGIISFIIPQTVNAQEWNQFRGYERDGKVYGFSAPAKWPAQLTQVWKIRTGSGDASPVLVGKKIFLHTRQEADEVVLCLDAITGTDIWADKYPVAAATGPAASHPGPRSTPAYENGKLVTFGISGIISCYDAANGKVLWRKDNPSNAIPQFYTGTSPLIADGMVIIQTGKKDSGSVLALDLKTGSERWRYDGDGPSYSSPSIMKVNKVKVVILFSEKNLIGLSLNDGKPVFLLPAVPQQRFYNCVSPYISGSKIYYSGQGSGTKAVEILKQGALYKTKELWSNPNVGAKWNTPVLKDGFLYGFTDQRRIYCLNAATGETAWLDNATNSDFATLVDCGTVLIGLPSTGNLIVFKPDHSSYSEVARYKVSENPVYSYPLILGNLVYIKDSEFLILYRIE